MSTTDVELLKQSLRILINDFQEFKSLITKIVGWTVAFVLTAVVTLSIALITK